MDDTFGFFNSPSTVINMDTPVVRTSNIRATQSVPLSNKITVEPFSGYAHENGQRFLSEFESYCTLQNLTGDKARITAAFHLHLKGPAQVWYNTLDVSNKLSWEVLRACFTDKYVTHNMFDPAIVAESAIFDSLNLQPHQPLEQFHSDILEKGTRLKKPERDLISKFISGLPNQLAFFVRAANIQTYSEALQKAKLGEAYGYRATPVMTAATHITETGATSKMEKMLEAITARLDRLETSDRSAEKSTPKRTLECFNCKGAGHRKSACNWDGKGTASPKTRCQLCQQYGHSAGQCKILQGNQ